MHTCSSAMHSSFLNRFSQHRVQVFVLTVRSVHYFAGAKDLSELAPSPSLSFPTTAKVGVPTAAAISSVLHLRSLLPLPLCMHRRAESMRFYLLSRSVYLDIFLISSSSPIPALYSFICLFGGAPISPTSI